MKDECSFARRKPSSYPSLGLERTTYKPSWEAASFSGIGSAEEDDPSDKGSEGVDGSDEAVYHDSSNACMGVSFSYHGEEGQYTPRTLQDVEKHVLAVRERLNVK